MRTDKRRAQYQMQLRTKATPKRIIQPATEAFKRLTELTHSEVVADRLICDNLRRNPDKDELWAAEKAIYDIERDRMAR